MFRRHFHSAKIRNDKQRFYESSQQHRASPLFQTHEQCIDALEKLNNILGLKHLYQYEGFHTDDYTQRFEKQEYPKLMAISYQLLKQYYNQIDPELITHELDLHAKKAKTVYILQFLAYFRQKLVSINQEQYKDMSLLRIAWTIQLQKEMNNVKSATLDVDSGSIFLETVKDLRWHYFEEEINWEHNSNLLTQLEQVVQRIQVHITQTASALSILFDANYGFLDQLNMILVSLNMPQITFNVPEEAILGCENLIPQDLFTKISLLAQRYLQTQKTFYTTNSLAVLCEFCGKVCVQYNNSVKFFLSSIVKEVAEVALLKTVNFTKKELMYGLMIYMLSGGVFNMSEAEFYSNIVTLLDDLTCLINLVFIRDKKVYKLSQSHTNHAVQIMHKKRHNVLAGCARNNGIHTTAPEFDVNSVSNTASPVKFEHIQKKVLSTKNDARSFYQAVNLLSSYLQPYMKDSMNTTVECHFSNRDLDLRIFLEQMGGIDAMYSVLLKLYLQLKSILKNETFSGIFDGISVLIRNVQSFNSGFGQLANVINDHIFETKLESGIAGVQQLLKYINRQLNFVLLSGTITDTIVVETTEEQESQQLQTEPKNTADDLKQQQPSQDVDQTSEINHGKYVTSPPLNEILTSQDYRQQQFAKQLANGAPDGSQYVDASLKVNGQADSSLQNDQYLF